MEIIDTLSRLSDIVNLFEGTWAVGAVGSASH